MTNIQPQMEHFERPDPVLTNKIVTHLKSQGIFDQFRKECMADVDTKPAYHNLRQRVEGSVAAFLRMNPWRPDMNKNQIRDNLRKHIQSGGFLDIGVDRIVDQVVNPKIYTVFLPKVEEVVQSCLGMENDKPKFEPPPVELKSEPPKFQDKHNLAPRAKLPAPLMGPLIEPLKPTIQGEGRSSLAEEKILDRSGDTDTEGTNNKKYDDGNDVDEKEEEEEEDDEESPPFEPHSEGDRLILGTRSDVSENSNDSQVVTTIVDDSLEEQIGNSDATIKEESDKKDEDSSSDEYVPKTPTINMEESDGTVLEFNSISEYKQYQTKFDEDSFGNVEEVVASQCTNVSSGPVREERTSNNEDLICDSDKIKLHNDSYDEVSNSSNDRESSDEIKPAVFESFVKKQLKFQDYDHDNETSELSTNDAENEDSYTEKSLDMTDLKLNVLENEHEKHRGSSTSSKDSGRNYHIHNKEHKESSSSHSPRDKKVEKEHHERPGGNHTSKEKKDIHKKKEPPENSRELQSEKDRKKNESSSKQNEKDSRNKQHDKERKSSKSSERSKKDTDDKKNSRGSKNEQKGHHHESKSRSDYDKEKKKHHSRDRHSNGKGHNDSPHKTDKHARNDSKHNHSSSKNSHRSSSEKHKSDKDHKHKESSDRHKSHDKKLDKEKKDESKKKYRQHCKYGNDRDENRRSSDRDSSGPSERTNTSVSSNSRSSRTPKESRVETSEKTTSNSDNTVSDNIEALHDVSNIDTKECLIASPDLQCVEGSDVESSVRDSSKDELYQQSFDQNKSTSEIINKQEGNREFRENMEHGQDVSNISRLSTLAFNPKNHIDLQTNGSTKTETEMKDDFISSTPLHDSSSEKENIEQDTKDQLNSEPDDNSTDASLEEDSAVVKFKKPKIAKNIHEVKKIMEARRHLKRLEKKRMKLLLKYNTEGNEVEERTLSENMSEGKSQVDIFRGFEDDLSLEKIKKYDCLTERFESEASQLEKTINYDHINSNLITSWIDLNPDLDTYIENTLKCKVHRRYRVHLPPICDEYYKYDADHNVYILIKHLATAQQSEVFVDNNLNNLNKIYPPNQDHSASCNIKSRKRKFEEEPAPSVNMKVLHDNFENSETSCKKHKSSSESAQSNDEVILIPEEGIASRNSDAKRVTTDVIAPQVTFSLTFNQTYDEVLKENEQNSVLPLKRDIEDIQKTPLTVVKITNCKTTEQVFLKKIQSHSEDKVPIITRSDSALNGKIMEVSDSKKIPLISRITKVKNISNTPTNDMKFQQTNGLLPSDSSNNYKGDFSMGVSRNIINDVIGIQSVSSGQGGIENQSSHPGEEASEGKRRRTIGCRQQQRYDSSDLYKPRPQLLSRRDRAVGSSPEAPPVPQVMARRKRSVTSELSPPSVKRRR